MVDIDYDRIDLDPVSLLPATEDLFKLLTEDKEIQRIRYSPNNSPRIWHEGCEDPLELGLPDDERDQEKLATMLYIIHQKTNTEGYIRSELISTKHQKNHGSEHQTRIDDMLNHGVQFVVENNDEESEREEKEEKKRMLKNVEVDVETYNQYDSLPEEMKERAKELTTLAEKDGYIETHEIREYINSNGMDWTDLAETDDKLYDEIGLNLKIDYPGRVARQALVEKKELEEKVEKLERELDEMPVQ